VAAPDPDADAQGALQARLAAIVEDTHDGVIAKDLDGVITAWNGAATRIYGYTPAEAIGGHISILIPSDHLHEEQEILARIRAGERLETYETERIRKDGVRIDVSLTVSPIRDPVRGIVGASVVAREISAEKRRRHAEAFLAGVAPAFHASLDPRETARTIAETAVPELGELCVIDLVRDDGSLGDATIAASDPEIAAGLRELRRRAPLDPDGTHPVARVIRSRVPLVLGDLTPPEIREPVAQSPEHGQFIASHGYNSAVVVPLIARGRMLGALSFLHVANDRRYDDDDLTLLEDLGARAATAIDNARLYRERSDIANTLQRTLRPENPPGIPGIEFDVVFEPLGEGIEVGGDFYDLFFAAGAWFVLIGDVVGKGPEAASLTGQIRHSVRALALPGWTPEQILIRVNALLHESLAGGRFASAQLLALRPQPDGSTTLELASAGHPPAVVCSAGNVRTVGGGTVVGVSEAARIAATTVQLAPGDLLLLYTDGWLDAGPVDDHRTPEALAAELESACDLPLSELLARLHRDALRRARGALGDDLVLLGLRPRGEPNQARVAPRSKARTAS